MQLKFKLDGREIAGGNLEAALEEIAFLKTKEQLRAKVADVRCPEHNQTPQLEFDGSSGQAMKVRIKTCCETLRGLAVAAMNAK